MYVYAIAYAKWASAKMRNFAFVYSEMGIPPFVYYQMGLICLRDQGPL